MKDPKNRKSATQILMKHYYFYFKKKIAFFIYRYQMERGEFRL